MQTGRVRGDLWVGRNKSQMWDSVFFPLRFKDSLDQIMSIGNPSPTSYLSVSCLPSTIFQPVSLDLLGWLWRLAVPPTSSSECEALQLKSVDLSQGTWRQQRR